MPGHWRCTFIRRHIFFTNQDIHFVQIELPVRLLESLNDHQIAIVFQLTAWASPAHTKTNRRPDDQLEVEEIFFFHQMYVKRFS